MTNHYQKAYFLISAADIKQLPPDEGYEVAIVGRSNAGKSSVLNKVTNNKGLARVSKTPGRTQLVNLFVLDDERRLVDLPGYGYAKVTLAAKAKWQKAVDEYIQQRECLKGLLIVMDIRHPLKPLDIQLLNYCQFREIPVHILLNKSDKLSKNEIAKVLVFVKDHIKQYTNAISYQTFSALKGHGLKELHFLLDTWYVYKN